MAGKKVTKTDYSYGLESRVGTMVHSECQALLCLSEVCSTFHIPSRVYITCMMEAEPCDLDS